MIFGLCCCLARVPLDRFMLNRHGWLQFGAGALLVAIVAAGAAVGGGIQNVTIPRAVGVGLLALLVVYMYLSFRWARSHPELIPPEAAAEIPKGHTSAAVALTLAVLAGGLAIIILSSDVLIGVVEELGNRYAMPDHVIAATLVAFGTSLPELATGLAAIRRGHPELMVGNIVGADILNVLFVTGASAAAAPLKVEPLFFTLHLPIMMISLILLRVYIFTGGKSFKRWQGLPLLALYCYYIFRLAVLRQF